jgi:hypothetical protein
MRSDADVRRVFDLWHEGLPKAEIARRTGVSRTQVRRWLEGDLACVLGSPMRIRAVRDHDGMQCHLRNSVDGRAYSYLLGQYLGDGHISERRRHVYRLRITACAAYPEIITACEVAMRSIMPSSKVGSIQRIGCTDLYSYSKHWPCLFPQHGPGRKHHRRIILEQWQKRIALELYPEQLLRGLIHSDGCRATNTIRHQLVSGAKQYSYPRYFFYNESADIRWLFIEACIYLEIEFRYTKANTISVAQRESVTKLDSFVGPKR